MSILKRSIIFITIVFFSFTAEKVFSKNRPIVDSHDLWCFSTARRGGGGSLYVQCGDCRSRRSKEVYDLGQCTR